MWPIVRQGDWCAECETFAEREESSKIWAEIARKKRESDANQ